MGLDLLMLRVWGLLVKGHQSYQPSNFENDSTPGKLKSVLTVSSADALYIMWKLYDLIFTISLAAIEVDLPKAVNACINHSWAYNGRRASPYLTWRTPPFLKLDRKSPLFSMELWPPKCHLLSLYGDKNTNRITYPWNSVLRSDSTIWDQVKEDRVKNLYAHSGE